MLLGRDAEQASVAVLVDEAWAGRGGALVVRGQPGVGKSTLLADAAHRAEGMLVLRTSGVESESPLAFAALQRLLRPALRSVEHLPDPQIRALRAAFGEVDEPVADRYLVFLAALSVLSEASEQTPVLAVVDDAQWLDDASAAALLFVARRLQAERVALLFAARDHDVRRFDSADLPSVTLSGIPPDAAAELLSAQAGVTVAPHVRDVLVARTGGNPLALVELPSALSAAQLSGLEPLPAELPLTEGVERAFLGRFGRLSHDAQTVLLVAAADDSERAATVRQAALLLEADEDAVEEVERSGLLRIRSGQVDLRHPLVRSAVYGAATSTERRRVHQALAEVLTAVADADRRAWHLAASLDQPDENVVAELDAAAERARDRGGHEAAASAWERAAELSAAGDARARRLYWAARAAWLAAQTQRARSLADAAIGQAVEPGLRADARRLRARVEWNTGALDVGHQMVLEGAAEVAPHDPRRAREMAMFAAALAAFGARSGTALDPAALVAPADADAPVRDRCFSDLLLGLHAVSRSDWGMACNRLGSAFRLADDLAADDQDLLPNLGLAALHLGDDELSLRYHELLLSRARTSGAIFMILYSLTRRMWPDVATGRWTSARAAAQEVLPLARSTGQTAMEAVASSWLAVLDALQGEESRHLHLADAERAAAAGPLGVLVAVVPDLLRWARGLGEASDPAAALHHFEQIAHPMNRRLSALDRIEAAVRAGRQDVARDWTDELAAFAGAAGTASAQAAVEHARALVADGSDAEQHYLQALKAHAGSGRVPDRARTQLAFGEFLRRSRHRVDARQHLRAALETFEDLGAGRWAERARSELRASGETARRRDGTPALDLTPQELQVARLIRQGLSNRDAAGQLFLSPRTIDFHLRNVFAKLEVTSRTELAALPLD